MPRVAPVVAAPAAAILRCRRSEDVCDEPRSACAHALFGNSLMARVFISTVVAAPVAKVWERVRDFNGLPKWHPGIRESRIENGAPSDQIGCVRAFRLQNGDRIRETLR